MWMILQLPTSPNMPNDPWRSIEPFICSIHVNLEPPTVINFPYHPCLYYTLSPHYSHFNLTSSSPKTLLADAVPLIFMTLSNHSSRADIPTYPNVTSKWVLTQLSQCLVSPPPPAPVRTGARWQVVPAVASASKMAQNCVSEPRCFGSSEGWKLMASWAESMATSPLRWTWWRTHWGFGVGIYIFLIYLFIYWFIDLVIF